LTTGNCLNMLYYRSMLNSSQGADYQYITIWKG